MHWAEHSISCSDLHLPTPSTCHFSLVRLQSFPNKNILRGFFLISKWDLPLEKTNLVRIVSILGFVVHIDNGISTASVRHNIPMATWSMFAVGRKCLPFWMFFLSDYQYFCATKTGILIIASEKIRRRPGRRTKKYCLWMFYGWVLPVKWCQPRPSRKLHASMIVKSHGSLEAPWINHELAVSHAFQ